MISDTLANAVKDIDWYLNDRGYQHVYEGEQRERIVKLRDAMDALRAELDTPPKRG